MERREIEARLTSLMAEREQLDTQLEQAVLQGTLQLKMLSGKIEAYEEMLNSMPLVLPTEEGCDGQCSEEVCECEQE